MVLVRSPALRALHRRLSRPSRRLPGGNPAQARRQLPVWRRGIHHSELQRRLVPRRQQQLEKPFLTDRRRLLEPERNHAGGRQQRQRLRIAPPLRTADIRTLRLGQIRSAGPDQRAAWSVLFSGGGNHSDHRRQTVRTSGGIPRTPPAARRPGQFDHNSARRRQKTDDQRAPPLPLHDSGSSEIRNAKFLHPAALHEKFRRNRGFFPRAPVPGGVGRGAAGLSAHRRQPRFCGPARRPGPRLECAGVGKRSCLVPAGSAHLRSAEIRDHRSRRQRREVGGRDRRERAFRRAAGNHRRPSGRCPGGSNQSSACDRLESAGGETGRRNRRSLRGRFGTDHSDPVAGRCQRLVESGCSRQRLAALAG